MKKSRFADSQIMAIFKQSEAGSPVPRRRDELSCALQVAGEVWRNGRIADGLPEVA